MYKLVVFTALLAVAAAAPAPGLIGAPLASPYGLSPYGVAAAPWGNGLTAPWGNGLAAPWGHGLSNPWALGLHGAPVVKTALPVATSYANTVRIAAPSVVAPAPLIAAHSPVYSSLAHGW